MCCAQPPGRHRTRKNLFNRLSQAVDEKRKEGYKVHSNPTTRSLSLWRVCVRACVKCHADCLQDVDEFFQNERQHSLVLTGSTKTAVEVSLNSLTPHPLLNRFSNIFFFRFLQKFLDVVQSEQSKTFILVCYLGVCFYLFVATEIDVSCVSNLLAVYVIFGFLVLISFLIWASVWVYLVFYASRLICAVLYCRNSCGLWALCCCPASLYGTRGRSWKRSFLQVRQNCWQAKQWSDR